MWWKTNRNKHQNNFSQPAVSVAPVPLHYYDTSLPMSARFATLEETKNRTHLYNTERQFDLVTAPPLRSSPDSWAHCILANFAISGTVTVGAANEPSFKPCGHENSLPWRTRTLGWGFAVAGVLLLLMTNFYYNIQTTSASKIIPFLIVAFREA